MIIGNKDLHFCEWSVIKNKHAKAKENFQALGELRTGLSYTTNTRRAVQEFLHLCEETADPSESSKLLPCSRLW